MSGSAPAATGQIVERPVERRIGDLEIVLLEEFLLAREQLGQDEGHNRAFDWGAVGEHCWGLIGVCGGEFFLAPRENRADEDLSALSIDAGALRAGRTF